MPRRSSWSALRDQPYPVPTGVRVALGLLGAATLAFVVLVAALGPGAHPWRDTVLFAAQGWLAAAVVLARGILVNRARATWVAVGTGMVLAATGDVLWIAELRLTGETTFPGLPDAFYLASYAAYLTAGGYVVRRWPVDLPRRMWLDALIGALALSGATFGLVHGAAGLPVEQGPLALATVVAYPIADMLLIATAIGAPMIAGWRVEPRLAALVAGLATVGLADLVYSAQQASGVYLEGSWLDVTWPAASLLLALAAWARPRPIHGRPAWSTLSLHLLPVGSAAVAVAVLVQGALGRSPAGAVVLAGLALVGGVLRLHLLLVEARRLTATARALESTDPLTGLANRTAFTAAAERHLAGARESGLPVALLVADLDHFRDVNESLGHDAGDALLAEVGRRLAATFTEPYHLVARIGGDDFAALLPGTDLAGLRDACARVERALQEPFRVAGMLLRPSAAIGMAIAPQDADSLPLLLRRADIAMDRAKADPSGHATYDAALGDPDGETRLQRIAALRHALASGQIVVHYQPKVGLQASEVQGVEALVRWERPGAGLVPPSQFLPLAEEAGLMPELTAVVLEAALRQCAAWRSRGLDLHVAVNLCPRSVVSGDLPAVVAAALATHGVPAPRLVLELTEDSLLSDPVAAGEMLGRVRALGVQVSVDDFGTGYSSLAYLRDLPIDELKLDRAFIAPMTTDPRAAAIVRSTIALGHALGLRVVAEGVEDEATAAELARHGCDAAQGYWWARPQAGPALTGWLAARARPTAGAVDVVPHQVERALI